MGASAEFKGTPAVTAAMYVAFKAENPSNSVAKLMLSLVRFPLPAYDERLGILAPGL